MTGQGRSAEGKETRSAKTNTHMRYPSSRILSA